MEKRRGLLERINRGKSGRERAWRVKVSIETLQARGPFGPRGFKSHPRRQILQAVLKAKILETAFLLSIIGLKCIFIYSTFCWQKTSVSHGCVENISSSKSNISFLCSRITFRNSFPFFESLYILFLSRHTPSISCFVSSE